MIREQMIPNKPILIFRNLLNKMLFQNLLKENANVYSKDCVINNNSNFQNSYQKIWMLVTSEKKSIKKSILDMTKQILFFSE